MNALNMLQSFTRANLTNDDLGYLCTWLMEDYKDISLSQYITKVNSMLAINFFDCNNTIKRIVDHYELMIPLSTSGDWDDEG
jgi:hypothetical protein